MKTTLVFVALASWSAALSLSAAEDYSRFAKVGTVSCDFRLERHLAIADRPLISSGRFWFRRPDFLRWEYTAPAQHGLLINGAKAFSWQTVSGKKEVRDISVQPLARLMAEQLRMFVSMDMRRIGERYKVEPLDNGVDLIPLNVSDAQQQIARIRLLFDATAPAVRQTVIMEKSGEKTVITYSNTQLDAPLPVTISEP
ncbi:MAG: outer membrane lipoprotein carrier protein LolA [Verrucomicrobiales bacterium]|jgi:outer membrane lipoprotein-sorting protein|nr:outer membrane lipoprotein carrier protein LolA [Verrucomicrobiales bacterium]